MNKSQLIDAMAKKSGLKKSDAQKALNAFMEATTEALQSGDKVTLVGFGTFSVVERAATTARNPQKPSEIIKVPARNVCKFSVGSELKEAVK